MKTDYFRRVAYGIFYGTASLKVSVEVVELANKIRNEYEEF